VSSNLIFKGIGSLIPMLISSYWLTAGKRKNS